MKTPHVGLHRPMVTGNTIPAELNSQRRALEKSNVFKVERPRAQRHSKAAPKASSSENSAKWALFFIVLLTLQHAALARKEITREERAAGDRSEHEPAGEITMKSPSDVQKSGEADFMKPRNGTCSDGNPYLADTILAMPSRKLVGMEILRNKGLDPYKNYSVTDFQPTFIGGKTASSNNSLINLYMEYQTSRFPFVIRQYPNMLDKLPDLDDAFDEIFNQYIAETSGQFSYECLKQLTKNGVDENDKADVLRVHIKRTLVKHIGSPMFSFLNSNRGYLLRVHTKHGLKYFAVSPKHCDRVVPLSNRPSERHKWVLNNLNLFFDSDSIERRVGDPNHTHHSPHITAPKYKKVTVHDAVVQGSVSLFEDTFQALKLYAYDATDQQEVMRFLHSILIPGYDAISEALKGNYKEAIAEAAMELHGEFLGSTLAKGAKYLAKAGASNSGSSAIRAGSETGTIRKGKRKTGRFTKLTEARKNTLEKLMFRWRKSDDIAPDINDRGFHLDDRPSMDGPNTSPMVELATKTLNRAKAEEEVAKISRLVEATKELDKYRFAPKESCEAVLEPLVDRLKEAGYDTKIRGMYLWSNANNDMPKNHFAVVASKDGMDYVVDLTAGQFSEFDFTQPIIATDDAWKAKYRGAAQRTLIKYKDFKSASRATFEFGTLLPVRPEAAIRNSKILAEPSWYKKVAGMEQESDTFAFAADDKKLPFRYRPMLGPLQRFLAKQQMSDSTQRQETITHRHENADQHKTAHQHRKGHAG